MSHSLQASQDVESRNYSGKICGKWKLGSKKYGGKIIWKVEIVES